MDPPEPRPVIVGRRGVVLPLVLLLLVALTLVANGTLYLARRELAVARASVRDVEARLAAEGAVRAALAGWSGVRTGLSDTTSVAPAGRVELAPGVSGKATVRRLGRQLYLVEGVGRREGWPGEGAAARLVWAVDPEDVVQGLGAVLQAGGGVVVEPGAGVEGSAVTEAPEGWEIPCGPLRDRLRSLYPGGSLATVERLSPAPGAGPGEAPPLLGPLGPGDLFSVADRVPTGSVTPGPRVRFGACQDGDTSSWGDPGDPAGPCGDRFPLIVASDSLVIAGGTGQGVLLVAGALRLTDGALFSGLVLVAGDLIVEGDSRIEGLVRVLGDAELRDGGRIVGSGCPVLRALRGAPGLSTPAPLPVRSWISPY